MKIYTRRGDGGSTRMLGGKSVLKSDPRIACCGTVDELNATLGWSAVGGDAPLQSDLRAIQDDLFLVGAHLSIENSEAAEAVLPMLNSAIIQRLEQQIDQAEQALAPLHQFILPGGSETAARLHVARTVCRRAERAAVELSATAPVPPIILAYLNRLGDWLFVYARRANQLLGVADVPWTKPPS